MVYELMSEDADLIHRLLMSFPIFSAQELIDLENLLIEMDSQSNNQPKDERSS